MATIMSSIYLPKLITKFLIIFDLSLKNINIEHNFIIIFLNFIKNERKI